MVLKIVYTPYSTGISGVKSYYSQLGLRDRRGQEKPVLGGNVEKR